MGASPIDPTDSAPSPECAYTEVQLREAFLLGFCASAVPMDSEPRDVVRYVREGRDSVGSEERIAAVLAKLWAVVRKAPSLWRE